MNIKPYQEKKTRQFNMYMTEAELKYLKDKARENNISMSQYIRNTIFFAYVNEKE